MGWIADMFRRGNTVTPAEAVEAIHAFHEAEECARWAEAAGLGTRVGRKYQDRAVLMSRQYHRLSQGLSYADLEDIAQAYYE